jgi:exocyst complex protein 7
VLTTIVNSLTTLSRTQKRPALGSIFLLNNISYLRQHTILKPRHEALRNLLSRPTQDAINSNFRTAKAAYFDSNFSPLMQALSDDPKEKPGKAVTKEKFTKFFDLLDEVMERHKVGKVLEDDEDGRVTIADEVIKLVVPSLQRFTQKHRDKEFSKSE